MNKQRCVGAFFAMLKILIKKTNRLFLPLLLTSLTCLLSCNVNAESNTKNILPPIIGMVLEDLESEYGSLIPGKLYSASELTFWRARAQNGPHVVSGDAYGTSATGSVPDYGIIRGSSRAFDSFDDSDIILTGKSRTTLVNEGLTEAELAKINFSGNCAVLEVGNRTAYGSHEFGRFDLARDAAFVDLLEGTSRRSSRIKELLLQQAQEPCINFANRDIFQNGPNNNAFWLYLEWIHRAFKAYDYLDSSIFTASERAIVDRWFKGAAEWAYYYTSIRHMGGVYNVRASNPINSEINLPSPNNPDHTGFWLNREEYSAIRIRYKGSSVFWPAGLLINNRQLGQLNFVVHAGVKYGNNDWKKEGAQIVKEYVSFHFDDDGYYAELNRASDSNSQAGIDIGIPVRAEHGLSYGANTLINIAEIAHILYLDGYENLFAYKSKARINESSGEIESGTVEKSLEWVLLKFRENFMLDNSPAIYPLAVSDNQENTDTVIHFCKNTNREKLGTNRVVGRMYNPAAIINRYYKNPLIKEIYNASDDYGNLCGFVDANVETRPGPHGVSPGTLFLYSDADENY